jgi:hypothetical protein
MSTTSMTTTTTVQAAEAGRISHEAYPPIDLFQTIDGLLKSHAAEKDQRPLLCYPAHGVADFEEHTGADLDDYTDRAVNFYLHHGVGVAVCNLQKLL